MTLFTLDERDPIDRVVADLGELGWRRTDVHDPTLQSRQLAVWPTGDWVCIEERYPPLDSPQFTSALAPVGYSFSIYDSELGVIQRHAAGALVELQLGRATTASKRQNAASIDRLVEHPEARARLREATGRAATFVEDVVEEVLTLLGLPFEVGVQAATVLRFTNGVPHAYSRWQSGVGWGIAAGGYTSLVGTTGERFRTTDRGLSVDWYGSLPSGLQLRFAADSDDDVLPVVIEHCVVSIPYVEKGVWRARSTYELPVTRGTAHLDRVVADIPDGLTMGALWIQLDGQCLGPGAVAMRIALEADDTRVEVKPTVQVVDDRVVPSRQASGELGRNAQWFITLAGDDVLGAKVVLVAGHNAAPLKLFEFPRPRCRSWRRL